VPLPAVYTASDLTTFMAAELGETGVTLGLDTDQYDTLAQAANEAVGILGGDLSVLTSTADLMKVRAVARWQAWLAASNVAAGRHDLDKQGVKSSQVFEMIQVRLAQAEGAALRYSEVQAYAAGGSVAYVTSIGAAGNPYAWPALTEFG
jgi:hypothetical protein